MSDTTLFVAAITATEWRSLLVLGEFRIARRRIQEVNLPPTPKERDRLFAWAPTTVLGDANDTLVIEFVENWLDVAKRHSAHSSELIIISLDQVFAHHAVSLESHSYLCGDAEKEGVELSAGRYESVWVEWVRRQEILTDLVAAQMLTHSFGITVDLNSKRSDGYAWHDIIRLARNSKTSVKAKPKHIEDLLRSVRQISDAVAGVHSSAAFTLTANIEWVATRLGKDPLARKALRAVIEEAIEAGRVTIWSADPSACPPVAQALAILVEKFPRAYAPGMSPEMVALATRLVMAAKDQTLTPIDVVIAIRRLLDFGSTESAANLCVAISGALGPTMSRRLSRALRTINPTVLNWS